MVFVINSPNIWSSYLTGQPECMSNAQQELREECRSNVQKRTTRWLQELSSAEVLQKLSRLLQKWSAAELRCLQKSTRWLQKLSAAAVVKIAAELYCTAVNAWAVADDELCYHLVYSNYKENGTDRNHNTLLTT